MMDACSAVADEVKFSSCQKTAVLVGSPNVGKSALFHALTGKYATVSNFPGTTVDLMWGSCRAGRAQDAVWKVCDTPGVVGLPPRTEDELIAERVLLESSPDIIIQVADSNNLPRALLLSLGLAEYEIPMVLVLNMADERANSGINIDIHRLSDLLGIPVVETVAITGEGVGELKKAMARARVPTRKAWYDGEVLKALAQIERHFDPVRHKYRRALAINLLTNKNGDAYFEWLKTGSTVDPARVLSTSKIARGRFIRDTEIVILEAREYAVRWMIGEVQTKSERGSSRFLSKTGTWLMRPAPGFLFALFSLFLMYEFVGVLGASVLVNFFENTLFGKWINPFLIAVCRNLIPLPIIQELLVGEYGVFTMAITYSFALILPIVTTFFLFFGLLEDSGYLPRLAVMLDRLFRLIGLNGRAVVPMVLGLGCGTMATVTTRILGTKKEKLIVSLLLTLSVPCSAQLGTIFGMTVGVSPKVLGVWLGVILSVTFFVGWAAAKLLPGSRSPLLIEIPPLRVPKFSNIWRKVSFRLSWYLKEVVPLFVLATVVLFVLDRTHLLMHLEKFFSPAIVHFLGLPQGAARFLLLGFLRRDYGAAGFFSMAKLGLLTGRQMAVSTIIITLFIPCIAHLLMTFKERGRAAGTGIFIFVIAFAFLVGGAVNWILQATSFLV